MKSPSGEMPQYLMIKAQLQARIQNGALKSGDKLPSERELCALFNTTRITVRESTGAAGGQRRDLPRRPPRLVCDAGASVAGSDAKYQLPQAVSRTGARTENGAA